MRVRLRSDIVWICYSEQHRWVAQDPLSNAFYYFSQLEYEAARLFDGRRSMSEIASRLNRRILGPPLAAGWLESFVERLRGAELLNPQPKSLRPGTLGARRPWPLLAQWIANPLAIRIPLLRPSPGGWLARSVARGLFHPLLIAACVTLFVVVSILLLGRWLQRPEQILYDITRLQGDRWIALLAMTLGIKSLHELGHYLASVRWRADCHEMGMMLLCFTPCFYCDTTQVWKLRSPWARAAVAGAGIYVELWLAGIGGLVCLNASSGLWQTLGAGAWIMGSLGTLLINGNPFFRYDGYYLLSDLWGVPNLALQARSALWQSLVGLLGGRPPDPTRFDRSVWQLAVFAILSAIYRAMVMIVIAAMVWRVFVPAGLGLFALFLLTTLGMGVAWMVGKSMQATVSEFLGTQPMDRGRFLAALAGMTVLAWVVVMVPLPVQVRSRSFVELSERTAIYVAENVSIAQVGQKTDGAFTQGELLLELDAPDKRWEWLEMSQELDALQTKIELLRRSEITDESVSFELPTLIALQKELVAKRTVLQSQVDALQITAPSNGYFVPSVQRLPRPFIQGETQWEPGHVVDASQQGMAVERGALIGWYTPEWSYGIHAVVPEADVRWIAVGGKAQVVLDAEASHRCQGTVTRISPEPLREFPRELVGDPSLVAIRNAEGRWGFETPHYLVQVAMDRALPSGGRGSLATVHFRLPGKTILARLQDALREDFQIRPE